MTTGPGICRPVDFEITNPDQASAWYSRYYRELRFSKVATPTFTIRGRSRATEAGLLVSRLAVTSSNLLVTDVAKRAEYIAFDILSGAHRYLDGQLDVRTGAGDVLLFPQKATPRLEVTRIDHRIITVTEQTMRAVVREHTDRESVRFTGMLPISEAAVRRYLQVSNHLERMAMDEEELSPIAVGEMQRYAASTMLHTFPNDALADPRTKNSGHRGCKSVKLAVDFISANFLTDISVSDIADAARVTPRTLTNIFRARFNMSPGAYLRRARLDWAHQELRKADPSLVKISSIARKAGWQNDSSFAKAYRLEYGVLPSYTLNRDP